MNLLPKIRAPAECLRNAMNIPEKLMTGPGPSNMSAEVAKVMSAPLIGHLHPEFIKIMDDVKEGIKYIFQTKSSWVLALSGTGHLAMEAACFNMLEPGEKVLVCENGLWGERFTNLSKRCGVNPISMTKVAGDVFSLEEIEERLRQCKPQAVFITHGESSAGTMQPLDGLGSICHKYGANLIVDTVVTAAGCPLFMDDWELDCVYSSSQKCLSSCPGISPIAFSERAQHTISNRKRPVLSWYLDVKELGEYWGFGSSPARKYHHTAAISLMYGLRESLSQVAAEGLEKSWARHQAAADHLYSSLTDLGLSLHVEDKQKRVPCVTTIKVPDGVDWKAVSTYCMNKHKVELAGGLGPTAGKVWRIGLMGANANTQTVDRVVGALSDALKTVPSS